MEQSASTTLGRSGDAQFEGLHRTKWVQWGCAVGMRSRICSVSKKTRLIEKKLNAIEYFKCYTFRLAVSAISSVNGLMIVAELYRKIVKVNENNYLAIT